jgi:hypothetical protein
MIPTWTLIITIWQAGSPAQVVTAFSVPGFRSYDQCTENAKPYTQSVNGSKLNVAVMDCIKVGGL